jgi:hypothetical protein
MDVLNLDLDWSRRRDPQAYFFLFFPWSNALPNNLQRYKGELLTSLKITSSKTVKFIKK